MPIGSPLAKRMMTLKITVYTYKYIIICCQEKNFALTAVSLTTSGIRASRLSRKSRALHLFLLAPHEGVTRQMVLGGGNRGGAFGTPNALGEEKSRLCGLKRKNLIRIPGKLIKVIHPTDGATA